MRAYVRISELGSSSAIQYRARLLGIMPTMDHRFGELCFTIEDAEKILGYRPKSFGHNIVHYETLEFILNDDKLRYDTVYAAKITGLRESKIQAMLDEYNKERCFIANSKINNDATE